MHIELKYYNPNTDTIGHYFFPAIEPDLAKDYLEDAKNCGCIILIWRLIFYFQNTYRITQNQGSFQLLISFLIFRCQ